jgi:Polyketide cyclase / dehydrase and lipid transport
MRGGMHVQVPAPVDDVFEFLADLRNESQWNPRVVSIEKLTPGAVRTGTRFSGRYQGIGVLDTVLVGCDRPSSIGFRSEGPRVRIDGAFTLSPVADGTDVSLQADLEPRGALRLVAPFMAPLFRSQNRKAAARLQAALRPPGRQP